MFGRNTEQLAVLGPGGSCVGCTGADITINMYRFRRKRMSLDNSTRQQIKPYQSKGIFSWKLGSMSTSRHHHGLLRLPAHVVAWPPGECYNGRAQKPVKQQEAKPQKQRKQSKQSNKAYNTTKSKQIQEAISATILDSCRHPVSHSQSEIDNFREKQRSETRATPTATMPGPAQHTWLLVRDAVDCLLSMPAEVGVFAAGRVAAGAADPPSSRWSSRHLDPNWPGALDDTLIISH